MKKVRINKKKLLIGLGVFLILFTFVFAYVNLTNPTKINSYVASVINKGTPINKAFEDEIFYKTVVYAYNEENKTSLTYTTNLTDE